MSANLFILLALHPLHYQGRTLLGDKWPDFCAGLRAMLKEGGREQKGSSEELLLFHFDSPEKAISSVTDSLARISREHRWQSGSDSIPVQIVLHAEKAGDLPGPMHDASAKFWDLLLPEKTYVTRPLKLQWEQLASQSTSSVSFAEADKGLYLLSSAVTAPLDSQELFPHRSLPLAGSLGPCFYCGMTNHPSANCPSKMLSMSVQGIPLAGYLPLEKFVSLFEKAFARQEKLHALLAAGVTASQLRHNPLLQVYLSFFDMNRTYQLRFLWNISFSPCSNWDELGKPDTVTAESHDLHLGLDCLRVGQHIQAEELLLKESRRPKGKPFYAAVGRAFVALEQERHSDMGHFLESALHLANFDKEKIYIALLLSRYYALHGDMWKAEHALDNVFSIQRDLDEGLYRRLQMMPESEMKDKGLRLLRDVLVGRKEFFLSALMDPQLLAVEGQIEGVLAVHLQTQRQEAEKQIEKARAICADLASWFIDESEDMASFLEDLGAIEQQFARNSFYDDIDVARKAKSLLAACYRLQESKLDEMQERIAQLASTCETFSIFWRDYPYQTFFQDFQTTLQATRNSLAELQKMAARNMHGQLYRKIQDTLAELEDNFTLLKPLSIRMGWVKIFLDGAKLFARKLFIAELTLLGIWVLLGPLLILWLANGADSGGLVQLVRQPWVQKQTLLVITLLVAPFLALAQTLWRMLQK